MWFSNWKTDLVELGLEQQGLGIMSGGLQATMKGGKAAHSSLGCFVTPYFKTQNLKGSSQSGHHN